MKTLQVSFHATVSSFHFFDDEKAQAAYTKAGDALKEYQRFKNNRAETVEIETASGISVLKLERMDAVSLSDDSEREALIRHALSEEVVGRRLRNEMGLPPLQRTPQETTSE